MTLQGAPVRLRTATRADIPALVKIHQTPQVDEHWRGGEDMVAAVEEDFAERGASRRRGSGAF
jgi:aminoglycoside 6'-N-acetyltransferase